MMSTEIKFMRRTVKYKWQNYKINDDIFSELKINYHKIYTFVQHIYNLLQSIHTGYMFRPSWAIIRPYI